MLDKKIVLTGASGFVAKNLQIVLAEKKSIEVYSYSRGASLQELKAKLEDADAVVHLAGVNRSSEESEFWSGNHGFTKYVCDALRNSSKPVKIIYSSSVRAVEKNVYGQSKLAAEKELQKLELESKNCTVYTYRLPNVFGKWCKPNYNSAVATFCNNIANDLPIEIHDENAPLTLVYVDDVVEEFVRVIGSTNYESNLSAEVAPTYQTTVGWVVRKIKQFKNEHGGLDIDGVGVGVVRALYSTYITYLEAKDFAYSVPLHGDDRGAFVEMLKTSDSGQFSYFTAFPGVTRGGHYHHTKTEKFLVIKGKAKFKFRNLLNDEYHELETAGASPEVVQTIPGWTHDITNIGDDELIVMLWANEVFDKDKPDTFARAL